MMTETWMLRRGDCRTGMRGVISGDMKLKWLTSSVKAVTMRAREERRECERNDVKVAKREEMRAMKSMVS